MGWVHWESGKKSCDPGFDRAEERKALQSLRGPLTF